MLQIPSGSGSIENKFADLRTHHLFSRILSRFLPLVFLLQLPFLLQAQTDIGKARVTISADRMTLDKLFGEIKKQTGFDVVFSPKEIDAKLRVSVKSDNELLQGFLTRVLGQHDLGYSVVNTSIIVKPKGKTGGIIPASTLDISLAEEITGVVYDEKGQIPLSGVSVVLKRTRKGTQTNAEGMFKLKEPLRKGDSLLFTIIGYQPTVKTIYVAAGDLMRVGMNIAASQLDQAIVQAYGVTSKRLTTGVTAKISGEEIRKQPVMNPLLALEGRVPGLEITPLSGYANAPVKVEIRGRNSLNRMFSNEPLYIIDGVQVTQLASNTYLKGDPPGISGGPVFGGISFSRGQSPLFGMNMNNIESVEVLMDADATAIYGARGANGVIIITTKRPKIGKPAYSVSVSNEFDGYASFPKLLDLQQYLEIRREAFKNDGIVPTAQNAPDLMFWDTTRFTNWQEVVYASSNNFRTSASVSGGDSRARASLAVNYNKKTDGGLARGANQTFGIDMNAELNSNDRRFMLKMAANYTYTFSNAIQNIGNAMAAPNAPPITNSLGKPNYGEWDIPGAFNNAYPWAPLFFDNEIRNNGLRGSLNASYDFGRGFSFSTILSMNINNNNVDMFMPMASQNPKLFPMGTAVFGISKMNDLALRPTLRYSKQISRGRLDAMAGFDFQRQEASGVTITAAGYTNDHMLRTVSGALFVQNSDDYRLRKTLGTVFKIGYSWEDKYILNLTGNVDGSSQFGDDSKFGKFGSIGFSWNANEEKWMERILPSWFNFLKFFANYGITGSNNVEDYQYLSQWSASVNGAGKYYPYNNTTAILPVHAVNQQYHWETTKHFSSGINMDFFNSRLNFRINYYRKITQDQLTSANTPYYTGFGNVITNMPAKLQNTGANLTIDATPVDGKDFTWKLSFNINRNRNKILSFPDIELSPWAAGMRVGASSDLVYLMHYTGVDPLTGNPTFEDHNKDGAITRLAGSLPGTEGRDDYIEIDRTRMFDGGLNTTFMYKGFTLNIGCSFFKQWINDPVFAETPGSMNNFFFLPGRLENTWRKTGDQALYPRFTVNAGYAANFSNSDIAYINAFVVRFNGVGMSYSLPGNLLRKTGMTNCTIGVTTRNFLLLSDFRGLDPQLGNRPLPKTISANLNINF